MFRRKKEGLTLQKGLSMERVLENNIQAKYYIDYTEFDNDTKTTINEVLSQYIDEISSQVTERIDKHITQDLSAYAERILMIMNKKDKIIKNIDKAERLIKFDDTNTDISKVKISLILLKRELEEVILEALEIREAADHATKIHQEVADTKRLLYLTKEETLNDIDKQIDTMESKLAAMKEIRYLVASNLEYMFMDKLKEYIKVPQLKEKDINEALATGQSISETIIKRYGGIISE